MVQLLLPSCRKLPRFDPKGVPHNRFSRACRAVEEPFATLNFREFSLGEARAVYAATTFSPQRGLSQSGRGRAKGRSPVLGAPTRLIQRSGRNGGGESPDRTTLTTDPNILVFKRC
jgi:hypothetical protein